MQIEKLLQRGEQQAVHMSELAKLAGVDERALRRLIYKARENGVAILSSAAGYYLPSDDLEITQFENGMRKRAHSALVSMRSARAERKTAKQSQIAGQLSIFDCFAE